MKLQLEYELKWDSAYVPFLIGWNCLNHPKEMNISRTSISEFIENWFRTVEGDPDQTYSFVAIQEAFGIKQHVVDYGENCKSTWEISAKPLVTGQDEDGDFYGLTFYAKEMN
jgi:hypothetical protein